MNVAAATHRSSSVAAGYFFAVLTVVIAWYTREAFKLPVSTPSSVIGPGFFPRYVGATGLALSIFALARELGRRRAELLGSAADSASETGDGGDGVEWPDFGMVLGASILFLYLLFDVIGAIPATIAFSFAVLSVLNRGRAVVNLVHSVVLAAVLYAMFDLLLDSGMPAGSLFTF